MRCVRTHRAPMEITSKTMVENVSKTRSTAGQVAQKMRNSRSKFFENYCNEIENTSGDLSRVASARKKEGKKRERERERERERKREREGGNEKEGGRETKREIIT